MGPAIALGGLTLVIICVLSATGHGPEVAPGSAAVGVLSSISITLHGGLFALAYMLGAIGLGRIPAAMLARGLDSRLWIQSALGVGLMLWVSHLLGCLGLLSGDGIAPRLVAWSVTACGIGLLLDQMVRGELAPEKWPALPWLALFAAPGLATLAVASANAPGWLWESEFGAYDALSYHLQLPKEWAANGLQPAAHNVYSYLPGYVEAGYLHVGQMMVGGGATGRGGVVHRMLGGDGVWVYSCQFLHALIGILAAILCGRCAWAVARSVGANDAQSTIAGFVAAITVLSTGWTIVCGSLAYNEMGVVLLIAGAMLLCVDRATGPSPPVGRWVRCAGIGLLVGLASSCKPTALLLVGPAVGILMLGVQRSPSSRAWARACAGAVIAGSIGGIIAIVPWLVRNALAAGNPVFPFAAELLGTGHWTAEQAVRHARMHAFDGSLLDRVSMLFTSRGWLHGQWGATPWLALAAAVVGVCEARTRKVTLLLVGGVACGLLAWLFFTHLQSRFLVPLIAPMAMLLGIGIAVAFAGGGQPGTPEKRLRSGLVSYGVLALLLVMPWGAVLGFLQQRGGAPNALLIGGVAEFTGSHRGENIYPDLSPLEQAATLHEAAGPYELINLAVQPGTLGGPVRSALLAREQDFAPGEPAAVYLLGDATPLYYLGATGGPGAGVVYHTTWDTSPLGDAIRASPDDPAAWTRDLRERGIGLVLINFDELARLIDRDQYFDPAVTLDKIQAWLSHPRAGCVPVKVWTVPGSVRDRPTRVLVRLDELADTDKP
jgi:hypothetical protein